jgi:transcriptional regulator with XRE-family HTH domain
MQNRIKDYRKKLAMTQTELAAIVGTTPQTISRLETGSITLSTDWLARLAQVFRIDPADLLERQKKDAVRLTGEADANGRYAELKEQEMLPLDNFTANSIALRLKNDLGSFRSRDILICKPLKKRDFHRANGRDCLVRMGEKKGLLCSVSREKADNKDLYTFMPLAHGQSPMLHQTLEWVAPLIMRISYL